MTSVFCSLGVALLLPATVLGGRNTQSTDTEYKYGGADVTGEHLGAMPHNTGVDMTKPNQAYCDGCLVAVEEFHMQWLRYVTKESQEGDEVDQKGGGNQPPAITYNDEVEDTVSDICKSKAFRLNAYTDQVAEVCQSLIGTEEIKRKIVAQFLAKDLNARLLPGRKKSTCEDGGLVNACPVGAKYAFDIGNSTSCGLCESVVGNVLFQVRHKKHNHGLWTQKSVFEIVDSVCMMGVLRHADPKVDEVYEVCESLMDEHAKAVVASIIKHYGDEAAVMADVCSTMTNHCAEGGGDSDGKNNKKSKKKKKKKKKSKKQDL